jgi:hypothetical protein
MPGARGAPARASCDRDSLTPKAAAFRDLPPQ